MLSGLGSGYIRPAPGTWGSLFALVAAYPLHLIGGPYALGAAALLLYFIGVEAVKAETQGSDNHDPAWIVVDEIVGQWIALIPVSAGAIVSGAALFALWPGILSAFVFFRLFDIWKPWMVGRADARDDAVGVMLDDVWAGVFAALAVLFLAGLAHAGMANAFPIPS